MSDFFNQVKEMKEANKKEDIKEIPQQDILEELQQAQTKRDTQHNKEELEKELYRRAIENIKISEWNRIQINKNNFEDKDQIIDILLYTIGKMALDPIFYRLNVQKLKDHKPIYEKEAE